MWRGIRIDDRRDQGIGKTMKSELDHVVVGDRGKDMKHVGGGQGRTVIEGVVVEEAITRLLLYEGR
jgi:hypothetical protein